MSTPTRTTAEKLAAKEAEAKQIQQDINKLKQKARTEASKERTHRLIVRGANLEKLLPDTIGLSDARFVTYLERTVANKYGRDVLASLKAEQDAEDARKAEQPASTGGLHSAGNATSPGREATAPKPVAAARDDADAAFPKPVVSAQSAAGPAAAKPVRTAQTIARTDPARPIHTAATQ